MSTSPDATGTPPLVGDDHPAPHLRTLDRLLPLWIGCAMGLGIALGQIIPDLSGKLDALHVDTVSLPIAVGLLLMMYPVLAKVRYGELHHVAQNGKLLATSLVLNWLVGPALMFGLASLMLPDLPAYRTGLIVVGLARCIAMVLIWNDLSCGNSEVAAVLVALNSLFQIVAYSLLGWFYLTKLPDLLGMSNAALDVSMWSIARAVAIFLGIPLLAGYLSRAVGERRRGRDWYEQSFLPRIGPIALWGLLFTIVALFALQGDRIVHAPGDVARIALPLLAYFALMWLGSMWLTRRLGFDYPTASSISFTAAGNNFELGIAVCIAVFGATSGQALAGAVGPLIEVPVLVGLVTVALKLRGTWPRSTLDA
ncbi:MAG: ACR3 family arsenite efflux transporter [Acidimicrobiia bacterium]